MLVRNIRSKVGSLVLASVLSQGCALTDTQSAGNTFSEPGLAAAAAGTNPGYIVGAADQLVKSTQGRCVRTNRWKSELIHSSCGAEAPVARQAPVPQGPGSVLVSYNARALFDFDSAALTDAGRGELDQLTAKLNAQDEIDAIEIVGHADSVGSEPYNQTLSENRADAVKQHLQTSLSNVAVSSRGLGESAPIADNNTEEGRRMNRRVDVNIAAIVEQ